MFDMRLESVSNACLTVNYPDLSTFSTTTVAALRIGKLHTKFK